MPTIICAAARRRTGAIVPAREPVVWPGTLLLFGRGEGQPPLSQAHQSITHLLSPITASTARSRLSCWSMRGVPETKYARNGDVHIAYQVLGDGPIDLLF